MVVMSNHETLTTTRICRICRHDCNHELVFVPIGRSYWLSASVGHMNSFCVGVGGMKILQVVFNIEAGN